MKNNFLYPIALLVILFGCNNNSNKIDINGKTSGYTDYTMLILNDIENEIALDTTYIINNKFHFSVSISEPTQFSIMTDINNRDEFEYLFFWVEDDNISIEATKGNLRYANIEGSDLQNQAEILLANKKPIEARLDSIRAEFIKADRNDTAKYNSLRELQTKLFNGMTTEDTLFIRNNPNSLHSAYILTFSMKQIPKSATKSLYENLTLEIKESKYGRIVNKFSDLSKDFKIGDKAVSYSLPDLNGNKISLSDYKDKYVLLEFWSSGCGPCRMENPNLLANYRQYKDKGFEILSITLDKNRNNWKNAVEKDSIIWTTVGDLKGMNGDIAIIYKIKYIPKNYLIDPNGVIIAEDLRGKRLREKLKEIFGE